MASSMALMVSIGSLVALYLWPYQATILSATSSLIEKAYITIGMLLGSIYDVCRYVYEGGGDSLWIEVELPEWKT